MAMRVFDRFPITFHDFGDVYMTDWQIELYDAIVGSLLPDVLEWYGDELLIDDDDYDDPSLEDYDLYTIRNEAFEKFCAIITLEEMIDAAKRYDVPLPKPGEPMYYEDSLSGDDVRDVNGERINDKDEHDEHDEDDEDNESDDR